MDFLTELLGTDYKASLTIIGNLILIESLLSIDNAAVLATMVMDLPEKQRGRALKYGIIGAYVFRGLSLIFVSYLVQVLILKMLGGLYLLWLTADYFYTKATPQKEDDLLNKNESWIYKVTLGKLGSFWATVVLVEFMDLSFSIDNVFAAVAFTDNLYIICLGVFIGIFAMRFAAQFFVGLISKFPFLESIAFLVIGILGIKLVASYACDFFKTDAICMALGSHEADLYVSVVITLIFVIPILTSIAFNYPKKKEISETEKNNA